MKKIAIIGNLGKPNGQAADGQTVKTRIVSQELINTLGKDSIKIYNTHGGAINLLKAPFVSLMALLCARNVLILPAHRGIRIYAPLLALLSLIIPNRRLHYSVIGGWLPSFVRNKKILALSLKRFNGIYAETNTMKNALEDIGYKNIYVVPNCKPLNIVNKEQLLCVPQQPYKLCTFSRVNREKGIGEAVEVVKEINNKYGQVVYTLDIYGNVDPTQAEWFKKLEEDFPDYIKYRGCVDFNKSVETIKNYFALLFPTHYYTEGIPGTIIDAYAAGVPVISAKWQSYADIIDDGETGLCYEFDNTNELKQILINVSQNPKLITDIKQNCIMKAVDYLPSNAIIKIVKNLL